MKNFRLAATTQTEKEISQSHSKTSNAKQIDFKILSKLDACKSGTVARNILTQALTQPPSSTTTALYNSLTIPNGATEKTISDADLAVQTNIRNGKYKVTQLIETNGDRDADRASAFLFGLFVSSSGSAIAANQALPGPEIFRFMVVWLLSFAPFAFVGAGISTPDLVQSLLVNVQRAVFPSYRRRMVKHEAGHFLMGHLLGMPIQGYKANAVKNAVEFYPLADNEVGMERARALGFDSKSSSTTRLNDEDNSQWNGGTVTNDKPFFSEGGKGDELLARSVFRDAQTLEDKYPVLKKLDANDQPKQVWPYRGFDHRTIDDLAVISMGGVCAEIIGFGNAEGGVADISQLNQLFANAEPALNEGEMENRVRYAIGYGITQLRRHLGALDALVEVMERDGSVEECVRAIETCENVSGATVMGNYEQMRKQTLLGSNWFERAVLSGGKNADVGNDRIKEGKGGGDVMEEFTFTGDDPLYAALIAAGVFFVWASNGGLSLH